MRRGYLQSLKGVVNVTSGYAGGDAHDADYKSVCSGQTGHAEVVHVEFSPEEIDFTTLLQVFLRVMIRLRSIVKAMIRGHNIALWCLPIMPSRLSKTTAMLTQLAAAKVLMRLL